jgi:glyoxylase-like metal-dependent hydrolase (beta-lactamase superfamily II)
MPGLLCKEDPMPFEQIKIFPINTGWIEGDLGTYLFWKGEAGRKIWMPVLCFYVDTGEYKIMVDTGLCDEERATKYHHKCQKRGCLQSPDALRALGVSPEEIDIVILTHLHWDHVQNIKAFSKARYICTATEIAWAYNPLPLYYRSYESPILGIKPAFSGLNFEIVDGETQIVPGVSVFPTPGHSPGHQSVLVKTSVGDIVLAGDAIFQMRNMDPKEDEFWRYWVPARFTNSIEGWRSVEELDKRADCILAFHDERVLDHPIYPFEGMVPRKRREAKPGLPFYFAGEVVRS